MKRVELVGVSHVRAPVLGMWNRSASSTHSEYLPRLGYPAVTVLGSLGKGVCT